jgi:two-component system, OmpR family, response regulator RpaA
MWYAVCGAKYLSFVSGKERKVGTTGRADRSSILLVEDDLAVSAAVADILHDGGYIVDQVASGRAALAVLMQRYLDLLLLDLSLPDIDGLEVCRLARRRAPDLAIIAVTGRTETQEVIDGFAAGVDDYIRKPFDLDVLLARIAAVLRARDQKDC